MCHLLALTFTNKFYPSTFFVEENVKYDKQLKEGISTNEIKSSISKVFIISGFFGFF